MTIFFNKFKKPCFGSFCGNFFSSKSPALLGNFVWISNTIAKPKTIKNDNC